MSGIYLTSLYLSPGIQAQFFYVCSEQPGNAHQEVEDSDNCPCAGGDEGEE